MVLSITLFLTVSFHSSPYYTGADIVFVFAWIPLVLAGSGGVLSLDGVIAARVAGEYDLGPPTVVPIRFALVQQVCGHYENDFCRAQGGRRCNVHGCPFLTTDRRGDAVRRRREVSTRSIAEPSFWEAPRLSLPPRPAPWLPERRPAWDGL